MGPESFVPQKVIDYVTRQGTVSVEEMMQDLSVTRITAKNYLSRLAKTGITKRIGRGLYQVGKGTTVAVRLPPEVSLIGQFVKERFPMATIAIWSLTMLADYAHYAIGRDLVVLETDRLISPSIRDALIEKGYRAILDPENRDFKEYAYYSDKTIFILERKEKYAVFESEGLLIPTPERIWLDLYYFLTRRCWAFPPSELGLMFANMLRKEGVNFNRLLRYARRRNLRDEMIIFLYDMRRSSQLPIPESTFVGKKEVLSTIGEMVRGAKE
ncbi:MAG: DUF6577 family protein [Candidatus Thorarchaeota archaeon]